MASNDLNRPLNPTYIRVILLEAAVIALLWLVGQVFS